MEIVFEDNDILVINKEAGLSVQTKKFSEKSLETELKKYRKQKGEAAEIYIVHRLDQPVRGLMVVAKNKNAAAVLTRELTKDEFSKEYEALLYKGKELSKEGSLRDYLIKDPKGNVSKAGKKGDAGAKEALLDYAVLEETDKTYKVHVHLHTGRHHQIRVQFANAGCPLLGDLKYGSSESLTYSNETGIKTVSLTACHLVFTHPSTKKKMEWNL